MLKKQDFSNEKPLVSILTGLYNREKYIAQTIESVLNQTYENWEMIIVDDRSTDKSYEIALAYAQKDSRIKVFRNEKNLGDYPNRNKAASLASGKYLKYLDSDDMLYPHCLEIMVAAMEKFPEAGMGATNVKVDYSKPFPYIISPYEAYKRHYFDGDIFVNSPLSYIIRKDVFFEVGKFWEVKNISDYDMWHKIALKYPVVLLPSGLTWYRRHDEQQMVTDNTDPFVLHRYFAINYKYLNHKDCPLSEEEKKQAIKKVKDKELKLIIVALKDFGIKKANQLIKNSTNFSWFSVLLNIPVIIFKKVLKCLFRYTKLK